MEIPTRPSGFGGFLASFNLKNPILVNDSNPHCAYRHPEKEKTWLDNDLATPTTVAAGAGLLSNTPTPGSDAGESLR